MEHANSSIKIGTGDSPPVLQQDTEQRQSYGEWLGIRLGVLWEVFFSLSVGLMQSVFLPSKQIKAITSIFMNLVKAVISLIQEVSLCTRLRST